jgi:Ca2+-binding EF-hand superfamily protein
MLALLLVLQAPAPVAPTTWDFLSAKYDADADGRIVPVEYTRGAEAFTRLDSDGDGALTPADFTAQVKRTQSENQRRGREVQRMLITKFQEDRIPDLGRDEMLRRLSAFDRDEDAALSEAEFRALSSWSPRPGEKSATASDASVWPNLLRAADADGNALLAHAELAAVFDRCDADRDGLLVPPFRSRRGAEPVRPDGPEPGDPAPPIGESAWAAEQPTVLLFGSVT